MNHAIIAAGMRKAWPNASEESLARYIEALSDPDPAACLNIVAEWAAQQYETPPTGEEELEAETNPDAVLRRHGLTVKARDLDQAAKRDLAGRMLQRRSTIVAHGKRPPLLRARGSHSRRPRQRRQRRHVARATSSADPPGSAEADGEPPPPAVLRALKLLGLAPAQIRWCRTCGVFAYAIDQFQIDQLDRLGFRDGLCPACARKARP